MKLNPFNEKVLTEKANKHGEELDSLNASISFFDGEKAVIEDLREVLEKEKEAAEKLKEVRKETHGGGVLLLDLAIQADIDRCNGEIQLAKKLLYMLEEKEARK